MNERMKNVVSKACAQPKGCYLFIILLTNLWSGQ